MIQLLINGSAKETSVTDLHSLIKELELPSPLLLVEYNGEALHRSQWNDITLKDEDRLELMAVAAGG
jgi:thiamine biosynthesis protein ThiS